MAVSRSNLAKRHSLILFFVLAYAFSWAVEIPLALRAQDLVAARIPWTLHHLSGYGPMLAAIIATGLTSGKDGLKDLFRRMFQWRVRPVWWLVALAPLVLYLLIVVVLRFIPGQGAGWAGLGQIDFLPNLGAGALLVWFLTFGLGEETGWRGFALPRLQRDRSALSSTVILWAFWALWHLPLFFYLYDVNVIAGLLLGLLAAAIVFTWLYNSSGGSVLMTAVWHATFNFLTGCVDCKAGPAAAVLSALVMIWAVVIVVWSRPATLSRMGKQVRGGVEPSPAKRRIEMRNRALWMGFLVVLLGLAACAPFTSSILVAGPEPTPARPTASAPEAQMGVIETPVVAAEVMGPGRFEYNDLLGGEILGRIQALRDRSAERALAQANAALTPFGYRLESRFDPERNRAFYDVYREGEDEPLLSGLASICRVSVNASGTEFVLIADNETGVRPPYVLVRNGQVEPWDPGPSVHLPPGYVGDALAHITATPEVTITYQVALGDPAVDTGTAVVYSGTAASYGAYMPLRSFTTWDDHWMLEVDDHLIMDGQNIGQASGYDAAFGFARIGGRSFYFFEQDGLVQISYGDQVLPNTYEKVFHNQCCEASIHNVEAGPDAVWFHALKDGTWYFVEASLEE